MLSNDRGKMQDNKLELTSSPQDLEELEVFWSDPFSVERIITGYLVLNQIVLFAWEGFLSGTPNNSYFENVSHWFFDN